MSGMIKYEWKKIWTSRLTQISVIGCSLFLVFCVCSSFFKLQQQMKMAKPLVE